MKRDFKSSRWDVSYCPDDGGRIATLRYDGIDLLTCEPESFSPPGGLLGVYEQRPVYGYDDCFPTVDACSVDGVEYADHGELWQRKWDVDVTADSLKFSVFCDKPAAVFTREMIFGEKSLLWRFSVKNRSQRVLRFMHVMHPLMPTRAVSNINVCEYERLDVLSGNLPSLTNAAGLADALMNVRDDFCEAMLSGVKQGSFCVDYIAGLRLRCEFPAERFPCVNIWWNDGGHPGSSPRREFAIEPTAGPANGLAELATRHRCMNLPADGEIRWQIAWDIERILT